MARLTRRLVLSAGISLPVAASAQPIAPTAASEAVGNYHLLMGRKEQANASPVWADVERWCDDEAAALSRLADAKGDLRDLLAKIIIIADRANDAHWNILDEEGDLIESMREQALELMRANGGQA